MNKKLAYILIPILIAVIMPFTAFKHTTANASELNYGVSYYTLLDSVDYIDITYSYEYDGQIYYNHFKFNPSKITQYQTVGEYPTYLSNHNNSTYTFQFTDSNLDQTTHKLVEMYPTPIIQGNPNPRYVMTYNFKYINSIHIKFSNVITVNSNANPLNALQGNIERNVSYFITGDNTNDEYHLGTSHPSYTSFDTILDPPSSYEWYDSELLNTDVHYYPFFDIFISRDNTDVTQTELRLDFYQTKDLINLDNPLTVSRYNELIQEYYELLGYEKGFQDGLGEGTKAHPFEIITNAVDSFLAIEIFPNFYVHTLLLLALGFTLFGLLVKYALGG